MSEESKSINNPLITPQNLINIPINIPLIYSNGVSISMSQSDIQMTFQCNGKPITTVATTIPVAKDIYSSLLKAISDYERKTNSVIPSLDEIAKQLNNS